MNPGKLALVAPRGPLPLNRRGFLLVLLLSAALLLGLSSTASAAEGKTGTLDLISIKGKIDPPTAEYLKARLAAADRDGVVAAVIQLDTPGAVDVSLQELLREETSLSVPLVVWIAPRGAEASGAGAFIAAGADLVFMAADTTLGPALPVALSDGDASDAEVAAAEAAITELVDRSGHDAQWATAAVRDRAVLSSEDAMDGGAIDGIASSLGTLLRSLDEKTVTTGAGGEVQIETYDPEGQALTVSVRFQQMDLKQQLLHAVTSPNLAYLFFLLGLFGLIFELYNPGIGLAAFLGLFALCLGFYALAILPTNWFGVLILAAAVVAFLVDLQIAGLGLWTLVGIAGLVAGGLVLFTGETEVRVGIPTIVLGVVLSLVFFMSVMTAALRVRLRRPISGEEGIVGSVAEAQTDIAPEGTVLTKGMLWRARTMEMGIAAGSKVEVKATEGLVLLVEPYHGPESE
jgi:membrane-bound serine protease (ClpP class)